MFGLFKNLISKLSGETKRKSQYVQNQREHQQSLQAQQKVAIPQLSPHQAIKIITFWNRVIKRRKHNLMRLNTIRQRRGLFQYTVNA